MKVKELKSFLDKFDENLDVKARLFHGVEVLFGQVEPHFFETSNVKEQFVVRDNELIIDGGFYEYGL